MELFITFINHFKACPDNFSRFSSLDRSLYPFTLHAANIITHCYTVRNLMRTGFAMSFDFAIKNDV